MRFSVVVAFAVLAAVTSIVTAPDSLASADWVPYPRGLVAPGTAVRVIIVRGGAEPPPPPKAPVATHETLVVDGEERIYVAALRSLLRQHAPAYAAELEVIGVCESGRWDGNVGSWYVRPRAVGDNGNSLGWLQLWRGWPARLGEHLDPFDPVDAIRLAVAVRETRGRFGGAGGWTCADLEGVR